MRKVNSLLLFHTISIAFFSSCNISSNKSVSEYNNTTTLTGVSEERKMIQLGFVKATIKDFHKETGCGFLLVLKDTKQILQTLNTINPPFQNDGLNVWIKYRPIRPILPECKKGIVIDLEEIVKM